MAAYLASDDSKHITGQVCNAAGEQVMIA